MWHQFLACGFGVGSEIDAIVRYILLVFHCIDDDMMNIDGETMFRSSVGGLGLWVVRLVSFEKLTL